MQYRLVVLLLSATPYCCCISSATLRVSSHLQQLSPGGRDMRASLHPAGAQERSAKEVRIIVNTRELILLLLYGGTYAHRGGHRPKMSKHTRSDDGFALFCLQVQP